MRGKEIDPMNPANTSTNLHCPVTLAGVRVAAGVSGIGTSFATGRASTTGVASMIVIKGEGVVAGGEMLGTNAGTIGVAVFGGVAVLEGVVIFGATSMTGDADVSRGVAITEAASMIGVVTIIGGVAIIVKATKIRGAIMNGVVAIMFSKKSYSKWQALPYTPF